MKRALPLVAIVISLVVFGTGAPRAQVPASNAVTPGEFVVEPATLINLGFEWHIGGDANRTASVEVSYRRTGDRSWTPALPLLRIGGERVKQGNQIDVTLPPMFAGSILDLEPGTSYDAQFVMKDTDGV